MAGKWWACDCCACDPDLRSGGANFGTVQLGQIFDGTVPLEYASCSVYAIYFRFATEAIARQAVGEGNYNEVEVLGQLAWVTPEWALFGDGTYSRSDGRSIPCSIETEEIPAASGILRPVTIDLNNGEFVWTRKSNDPESGDFVKFELTTGPEVTGGNGLDWCIGINARSFQTTYVWEGDPQGVELQISSTDSGTPPCEDIGDSLCLEFQSDVDLLTIDDWRFGGSWSILIAPFDVDCGGGPQEGSKGGALALDSFDRDMVATVFMAGQGGCFVFIRYATDDCRSIFEPPSTDEFTKVTTDADCDPSSFDQLEFGGDCGGDGCDNEDCPVSFCKWIWSVEEQVWELLESNCITPSECGDPPPDPEITDQVWTTCTCCSDTTPPNPCPFDYPSCGPCTWTYDLGLDKWLITASCVDITCLCCGRPEGAGLFDGETREGFCCDNAIAGTGCGEV